MAILSIQSHVAYGYVGNKAAAYPLQSMGYDVWPVNTVQFSNHTGYGKWGGEVFSREHIRNVIQGIEALGVAGECQAVLSGYMGSREICEEVAETVARFKAANDQLIYLCDPVIGNTSCYVKPEVLEFFQTRLLADIVTPNQYEAETLSGVKIDSIGALKDVAKALHGRGIRIVVITGIKIPSADASDALLSCVSTGSEVAVVRTKSFALPMSIGGTGDLFSAVYLGSYLRNGDPVAALQHAVYYVEKVLANTLRADSRELQVISERYELPSDGGDAALPKAELV